MVQTLEGTLGIPANLDADRNDIWLEQQLWGHRFFNDQSPWMLLLEAVGVMAWRARDLNAAQCVFPGLNGGHEQMRYEMAAARSLRRLLFADRRIDEVADQGGVADNFLWKHWLGSHADGEKLFGYLQGRFANFAGFRNSVALLRSCQVEPDKKRRYTSCHLAPRGPAMLSGDFGERKGGGVDKDRRFFRRGGELLYLMLNRSTKAADLERLVKKRMLSDSSRWNRLARQLAPEPLEASVTFENIGYLPLASHPVYNILADDWAAVLSLNSLPDDNLSEPLMRLSALGVIRYILERAAEALGEERPLMPLDCLGPETAGVRKLARDAMALHRDMTRRAVETLVEQFVASAEWKEAAKASNARKALLALVKERLAFSPNDDEVHTADDVRVVLRDEALEAHNAHLGLVPGLYAEQIGLAAKQGAARRYAVSDPLAEALVLANVREPMEFEAFLMRLHERYGFVIGTDVGNRCYDNVNHQQLRENQRHLEERLRTLGLSKRLSDDCAFVVNPFWDRGIRT